MTFTLDLWQILSLYGTALAVMVGAGRVLLAQVERRLDLRFQGMEENRSIATTHWTASFATLQANAQATEQRLTQLLVDLPLHYQLREDAVRQEVGIIHRLDALSGKVDHALNCDVRFCPNREHLPGTP